MTDQPEVTEEELSEGEVIYGLGPYQARRFADTIRSLRAQQAALVEALERTDSLLPLVADGHGYYTDSDGLEDGIDIGAIKQVVGHVVSDLPAAARAHVERDAALETALGHIGERPCEASAFHEIPEDGVNRCIDPEYVEMSEWPKGLPLILCAPCESRAALADPALGEAGNG